VNGSATESAVSIDATFERVTFERVTFERVTFERVTFERVTVTVSANPVSRFGRVKVTAP
jgi:hypothetical protein